MDIYIDWLDDGMPKITGRITTARINENNKFFLASEWCN